MSVDFDALFFYGMPVANDKGWDLVEIFEELNGPLEIACLDSYSEDSAYMLFVRESYKSGDKNSDPILVRLSEVTGKEAEWQQLIQEACNTHQIEYAEPDWYFATAYS